MIDWLDKDVLLNEVKTVTTSDPKAIECMKKRSESAFDYADIISSILKFIGETTLKNFGESEKFAKRRKSNEESQKLREEANKVFLSKNNLDGLEESLALYTKCIAFAVPDSLEMAMGFANRSAVLLKLNRPKESLEDIERALNLNYPEELMPKLLFRKAQCFSILAKNSYIQSKFWLDKVPTNDSSKKSLTKELQDYSEVDYESTIDKELVIPKIKSPHAKFPCASDAIDIEYLDNEGKKIVATRDIRVGEVLIVEKPYFTRSSEQIDYLHCENCSDPFWTGIPCDNCVNSVYCSEKCKLIAWQEYHGLECSASSFLIEKEYDTAAVERTGSLKLLIKFSHEAGGLEKLKERVDVFEKNNGKRGKLQREWYEKQTLESILYLMNFVKKLPNEHFQSLVANAIRQLFYLAKATDLFGQQYSENMSDKDIVLLMAQDPDVLFVGGLLLQIHSILQFNANPIKERGLDEIKTNYRGTAVMPFMDLFEYSCYNNVVQQSIGEFVVGYSIAPIEEGEELFFNLGNIWMVMPQKIRHSELEETHHKCAWKACGENWPTIAFLESFETRAKSRKMKNMLQKVMRTYPYLEERVRIGDIMRDKESVLASLNKMMEAIYQGANLPCREQALLLNSLTRFYFHTGNTSKIQSIQHQV